MHITQTVIHSYLEQRHCRHTTMVRHHGHVIVLAMDADRRIKYTVLDLQEDSDALDLLAVHAHLERMDPLDFPAAFINVRHGASEATQLPTVTGDPFLSSTARFTADVPFQVISDGADLYLFRQSRAGDHADMADDTMLLDCYAVEGSRVRLQSTTTDVLDFVRYLHAGRFTAMLLPTSEANTMRWQIFAYNAQTERIDTFNVKRSADGRCDPTGRMSSGEEPTALAAASALRFTTNDTYVDCGVGIDLCDTDFTIELWARCTTRQGGNQVALAHGQGDASGHRLQIGLRDTNQFTFAFAADDALSTRHRLRDGDWHHWACIYRYANRRREIYCDGVRLIGNTAKASYSGMGPFLIGKAPQGAGWRGDIDEVRIWRHARSAEDIRRDRSHRLVGDEAGLVAYWRLDEGVGDITHDRTDHAHHGALHGNIDNGMWVTSSAPVRAHPGLDRSSFALAGHPIASGLSALLYPPRGDPYAEATPASARVMLAVGTESSGVGGSPPTPRAVAVLDFAVSPQGTLGQAPETLSLPVTTGDAAALVAQLQHHTQDARELLMRLMEGFVEQARLTASDMQAHAYFGGAVAIDGECALVGAREDSPGGIEHAGSVTVFRRENGGWAPRQVLSASDREAEAHFGIAVALHGEWALVGADTATADGVAQAGKAYVFQRGADDTWRQRQILTSGTQQSHTGFGSAVALYGEWALIGAYGARADGSADAGSAYLFRRDGATWGASQTLTAPAPQTKAYFGSAVAVAGDWSIVGADGADIGSATHAGRAEIFHYQDGTWVHHLSLAPRAPQAHARFGRAVALSDMWAVVGADGEAAEGKARAGSAYLFQRLQGTWVEKQPLVPRALQAHAAFGQAVALHGDTALVGAPRSTIEGRVQAGSLAVFESLLTTRVAAVAQVQATMHYLHAQLANVAQPIPWLHTAPSGLTLYGGVLEGIPVEDPPSLVDHATGAREWPTLIWQGYAGPPAEVEQRRAFGKA